MKFIPLIAILAAFPTKLQMFGPDTGGGGGGGGGGETLRQQLDAATKERDDAKAALIAASKERDDAKAGIVGLTKERDDAKAALIAASKERDDAKAEVTNLKGEAKTASERANEIAAANGVKPTPKAEDAPKGSGGAKDGAALFAEYQALMKSDAKAASAFWAKHEAALMAYGETVK